MVSIYDVGIKCDGCTDIVRAKPPQNRRRYALIVASVLGIIGLGIGLTIGVATAGFGMAAFPFTTIIGAYVGYKSGGWYAIKRDGILCPECGHDFA